MPADPVVLEQLLLHPHEELDREYKNWLDMANDEDRAKVAKEVLALANYGGGYLIFGFEDGTYQEAAGRPASLDAFDSDVINSIVARYADPPFECLLYKIMHPKWQKEFPIVCVPGSHRVPIRCKSTHSSKTVEEYKYYTRLPGARSSQPRTAKDWDDLIRRCVQNSKEDLLNSIRIIMSGQLAAAEPSPSSKELLNAWISDCNSVWESKAKAIESEEGSNRFVCRK